MTTQAIEPDKLKSSGTAAAEWIARLRAPDRDEETERAFRRWLDSDPSHAAAFNRATEIWEALGSAAGLMEQRRRARMRAGVAVAAPLAAAVLALAVAIPFLDLGRTETYRTAIGEQRTLMLEDGSQVTLNTDSDVRVRYTRRERKLELARGEAIFDVAKNPRRPFTVRADGREVRALGTSFVVSAAGQQVEVTLLAGKVSIAAAEGVGPPGQVLAHLTPGQQWRSESNLVRVLDPRRLEAATSWRRQEVEFDDTPLADAITEMNRYTPRPIVVTGAVPADERISGIFRTTDAASFARTISSLYGVDARLAPAASP